jgi:hypothetical protein
LVTVVGLRNSGMTNTTISQFKNKGYYNKEIQ